MKTILFILLTIFSYTVNGQSLSNKITYVSPNKDTLLLPDNEIGRIILQVWEISTYPIEKPLILVVPVEVIRRKNYFLLNKININ
jgi:hypothetical protein